MTEKELAYLAVLFIVFWLWTLDESTDSLLGYLVRSVVVLGYQLTIMPYEGPAMSLAEWIANFLVWSHWFSAVSVFLYPDPRFQKKKTNA